MSAFNVKLKYMSAIKVNVKYMSENGVSRSPSPLLVSQIWDRIWKERHRWLHRSVIKSLVGPRDHGENRTWSWSKSTHVEKKSLMYEKSHSCWKNVTHVRTSVLNTTHVKSKACHRKTSVLNIRHAEPDSRHQFW